VSFPFFCCCGDDGIVLTRNSEMLIANYFPKMMSKAASFMQRPALPEPQREKSLLD
jgi:hypothetical protein